MRSSERVEWLTFNGGISFVVVFYSCFSWFSQPYIPGPAENATNSFVLRSLIPFLKCLSVCVCVWVSLCVWNQMSLPPFLSLSLFKKKKGNVLGLAVFPGTTATDDHLTRFSVWFYCLVLFSFGQIIFIIIAGNRPWLFSPDYICVVFCTTYFWCRRRITEVWLPSVL